MLVVAFALALFLLLLWSRREGFSVTVKADGGMVKALHAGTQRLVQDSVAKVAGLPEAAMSMVPFRSKFRQWNRHLFKKNIGLDFA
jgi:hypothetical protein